ncbi:MAG: hypothetical protein IPM21_02265 [Acidobacteria bacterium]|nr:hypothetical protein [Acidobacteriota bacterium]
MTFGPRIEKIEPNFAAGDGYVHIFTAGLSIEPRSLRVTVGGKRVVKAAGPKRIIVRLPESFRASRNASWNLASISHRLFGMALRTISPKGFTTSALRQSIQRPEPFTLCVRAAAGCSS